MSTDTISIDEEINLKPETIEARAKIARLISSKEIKPFTLEELSHKGELHNEQTQEEIKAEVDDFLYLLREWRDEPYTRSID